MEATPAVKISETTHNAPRSDPKSRILRQYELVERVVSYDPEADEDLLNRAYVYAMQAHGSQLRASGDPYFSHPIEVAGILTEYKLDTATIVTALLHDVVEDTGTSLETIERLFGPLIRSLVDGVTKLNKLDFQTREAAQAENFRKLLLAISHDIRVLLVKLSDRLHNMRTLHFIRKPEKRQRIARETEEIYAPLAGRIGMVRLQEELEELAFKELRSEDYHRIIQRLNAMNAESKPQISDIEQGLQSLLAEHGINSTVKGRQKSPCSIWRKMQTKNVCFEQLSDVIAFRAMVPDIAACYGALGAIHGRFMIRPGRFKDYISTPKENGYRSLHTTVIGPAGQAIEIQIRTQDMHDVAELGVAAHWVYKQKDAPQETRQYRWLRDLLDIMDNAESPAEFMAQTRMNMFNDQVFCFTPKGDVIALPRGATAVDFAYAVHSAVGDHCKGVRIDGHIAKLSTPLQNGNVVLVETSKSAHPKSDWERFAITGRARSRIRRYVRMQRHDEAVSEGRAALERASSANGQIPTDKQLESVANKFSQSSAEGLLAALGEHQVTAKAVLDQIFPQARRTDPAEQDVEQLPSLKKDRASRKTVTRSQHLRGLPEHMAVRYAKCCSPVPGDPIIGVVNTGSAVSIHRTGCGTLERLSTLTERWLSVDWADDRPGIEEIRARLRVDMENQPGVLGFVTTSIGAHDGNITDIHFGRKTDEVYEITITVAVENLDQLARIMAALQSDSKIASVSRIGEF